MSDIAKQREQAIGQQIGAHLEPITAADDLLGDWEMRFGGPAGSDKVQWRYGFHPDGSVQVSDEQWHWKLNDDGTLSLLVATPADAATPGLEEDATTEELMFPYRAEDGRVVLSNDDTSLIEVLTKVSNA